MIGEIGCSAPWTATEKRVMQAALVASAETGAAINVHPGRDPDQPQEVADFIKAAGHPTERIVISHIDRTIFDETRLLKLADSGVTIEFDLFGQESSYYGLSDIDMPNDATRLRLIRALIGHGHLDRVVISHDICYRTRLASFGGHGYGHIFRNVVPMMQKRSYSADEIDAILVRNPRRPADSAATVGRASEAAMEVNHGQSLLQRRARPSGRRKVIRPFDHYAWAGVEGETVIEDGKAGDQVGAVRRVTLPDRVIRQKLLAHSDIERFYTYHFCEPAPVRNYVATIHVVPVVASRHAFVEWQASFDCAEDERDRWVRQFEQEGFAVWLAALRRFMAE